jgi:hypothetical protein
MRNIQRPTFNGDADAGERISGGRCKWIDDTSINMIILKAEIETTKIAKNAKREEFTENTAGTEWCPYARIITFFLCVPCVLCGE